MPLEVIGAGFGRTGTMSLKLALEELGFGPCYHMVEVDKNPGHVIEWTRAADGDSVDWDDIFRNYHSGVDWPVARYWHELSIVYPKSKFILTVRDPERWYASCCETIFVFGLQNKFPVSLLPTLMPSFGRFLNMVSETVYVHHFNSDLANKEKVIAAFNKHNEEVKATLPADRLLVFDAKEGWGPLCAFLGVPVPNKPYPHVNDAEEFKGRLTKINCIAWAAVITPIVVTGGVLWALNRTGSLSTITEKAKSFFSNRQ